MEGLEAGRPVVIYGQTANRSEVARLMLQPRGYEAHVMEGVARPGSPRPCPSPPPTAEAWVAQALPVTTPDGQPGRVARPSDFSVSPGGRMGPRTYNRARGRSGARKRPAGARGASGVGRGFPRIPEVSPRGFAMRPGGRRYV
jgi:hypothetical protein